MLQKKGKNRGESVILEDAKALKNEGFEFPRPHLRKKGVIFMELMEIIVEPTCTAMENSSCSVDFDCCVIDCDFCGFDGCGFDIM